MPNKYLLVPCNLLHCKCSRSSYWTNKRNSWINAWMVTATMRTGVTLQSAPFCIWLTLSYQSTEISTKHPQWANLYVLCVMQNSQVTVFGWKVKGSIRIAGHDWAGCAVPRGPNGGGRGGSDGWNPACLLLARLPGAGLPHPDKALFSNSHKGNTEVSSSP